MRPHLTIILSISFCLFSSAGSIRAEQILDTATFQGHTYHLVGGDGPVGTGIRWTVAQTYAEVLGGNLVTIETSEENDFVYSSFASAQFVGFNAVDSLLIGFTDAGHEGNFVWISGIPVTFTNWASGEPTNTHGNEHYGSIPGAINKSGWPASRWNDIPDVASTEDLGIDPPRPMYGVVEIDALPAAGTDDTCAYAVRDSCYWDSASFHAMTNGQLGTSIDVIKADVYSSIGAKLSYVGTIHDSPPPRKRPQDRRRDLPRSRNLSHALPFDRCDRIREECCLADDAPSPFDADAVREVLPVSDRSDWKPLS